VPGVANVSLAGHGAPGTYLKATLKIDPYATKAYALVPKIRAAAKRAATKGRFPETRTRRDSTTFSTRPASMGTAANEMISSCFGSSPLSSRSTTQKWARRHGVRPRLAPRAG